jgi:hypothetical protein
MLFEENKERLILKHLVAIKLILIILINHVSKNML